MFLAAGLFASFVETAMLAILKCLDWKLAQKEPFFSRKRHVMEMCRRKIKITSKILSERINFSDRIKLIMCETPKVSEFYLLYSFDW